MPKLLLADDSPTTQKVVQLTFADEGIDVLVADDGDAAMELFDHHKPDIVLADINMPGLNGYEVCEAIRNREPRSTTPVVLLAGSFEPFDVEAAHRVGANDYLTKPFSSIRRLVATVTALLDTVVRADDTAHDTVEPLDETPAAEAESVTPSPMSAPGTKDSGAAEPDIFSTSDIDHLYTESIVEQPGTIESARSQSESTVETAASGEEEASDPRQDESAFDDELIETTYLGDGSDNGQSEVVEHMNDHAPSSTTVSLPHIPLPADDLPANSSSIPQSQIPTVSFEVRPAAEPYGPDSAQPVDHGYRSPVESSYDESKAPEQADTSHLDQSGDETYFELAVEQGEASLQPQVQKMEADTADQISVAPIEMAEETRAEEIDQNWEQTAEESGYSERLPAEAATPWDSVATEQRSRLLTDDANLLEVPYEFRDHVQPTNIDATGSNPPGQASEIAPEIVERIAQLTAAQISEEMVREIAKRIVPQVIDEVLTAKAREE